MYFNVNFNVFFKLIKVHLLVSELYKGVLCKILDFGSSVDLSFWNMTQHHTSQKKSQLTLVDILATATFRLQEGSEK